MTTQFGRRSTAEDVLQGVDLSGKTVLLTGGNSGLGFETMRVMSRRGAHVMVVARTLKAATEACARVGGTATPIACDLSDFASVAQAVETVTSAGFALHCVIANAGIMMLPRLEQVYGLEKQFVVNYLGHFMLINGIIGAMPKHAGARIVIVASGAHKRAPKIGVDLDNLTGQHGYNPARAYGQSNVARILFTRALSRRLASSGITVNTLRPGTTVGTGLFRHTNPLLRIGLIPFSKTIPQGAATQCYLAAHPDVAAVTGQYFSDCRVSQASQAAQNDALGERLWALSENLGAAHGGFETNAQQAVLF
jgi:WW domain-containing oxidoreductase